MEPKGLDHTSSPDTAAAAASPAAAAAPGTLAEAPRRRGPGGKRKASSSSNSASYTHSKRQAKERNHPLRLLFPTRNGPLTRARQSPNKHAAYASASASAALGSGAALQKRPEQASVPSSALDAGGKDGSAAGDAIKIEDEEMVEERLVDVEFEAVRSRGSNVHAVPTPAGWFSWNTVHPIEKHMMASFFNGKSEKRTQEVYMDIRNSIMMKFHENPQRPVEFKDFTELPVEDMDTRKEVLGFLDHWGLINFHPFLESNPDAVKCKADGGTTATSLVDKLYQFEAFQPLSVVTVRKEKPSIPLSASGFISEASLAENLVIPVGPSVEYHCNSCSADCSRKRYHCPKEADYDLCNDCYNDGKFSSGIGPADFILMESADNPGVSGGSWTDQETLLLLEALELFGENWNEIGEHVATKTKTQCILHFLQMPIEDSFLEDDNINDDNQGIRESRLDNESANATIPEAAESNMPEAEVEKKETAKEPTNSDDCETKKNQNNNTDSIGEPTTSKTEPSLDKDALNVVVSHETGSDYAIEVLKAAFQAVGYFPEKDLGSFAEAGNPIMALAAFLAGIVESDVAITSFHSSLKAISEDSPGIQLATRHCYLLGDPPKDNNDLPSSLSAVTDLDNEEPHMEETEKASPPDGDKSKVQTETNEDNAALAEDKKASSSLPDQSDMKASIDVPTYDAMQNINGVSTEKPLSEQHLMPSNTIDRGESSASLISAPSSVEEKEDLVSQGEVAEANNKELNGSKSAEENLIAIDSQELASKDNVLQNSDSAKAADSTNISVVLEQDCQQETAGTSLDVNKDREDASEKKEPSSEKNPNSDNYEDKKSRVNDSKSSNLGGSDGNQSLSRLKRAAVAALSAAAVKSRILAIREENEIRQLVSLIIEKQLHKLEAKLTTFAAIENFVMRMREHTERAKKRLFEERSQIIAARMGIPPSAFRANVMSFPGSRATTAYGIKPINVPSQILHSMRRP